MCRETWERWQKSEARIKFLEALVRQLFLEINNHPLASSDDRVRAIKNRPEVRRIMEGK